MSGTTGPSAEESALRNCEDCVAPEEAFSVIANESRLSILEALWKADERPVSFSELRREVGMRDSAQFNYHLKQLTDHFVVGTDEGYDFRQAGKKVVRSILAGSFNEHPEMEPFELDETCALCGGSLEASYDDEMLAIDCLDCAKNHGRYPFPPGGLNDRTRGEIMDAFNQRVRHLHCLAADGVCPECNGRMSTAITHDTEDYLGLGVRVDHRCEQCRHRLYSAVGLSLLDQSDVVTFHRDHGVDVCTKPYWDLAWCVTDEHTTVLSEDPWRIRVEIPLGDEVLAVTLDGDLDVVELERECGSTSSESARVA
ncbi:helix-turn-helix domain-containing protein [Halorussus salilacus]|uniref:winged helix-turn-helix domain-containing protein n=1 Tax=Halorussus salilacus TaxID=2953750 RepID=UPI0020A127E6|nr:helix-turn-helix domain-containing protein [Halorussus salilacus]USZ67161.1 helix-turn-helix domain-containing protein [Halorussus salilacus]